MLPQTRAELAACIDHSLLAPSATELDVRRICSEALAERFAAVCVNGCHAALALLELSGDTIPVAVTIGFPLGASSTPCKLFEAREALELGAGELDVVLALGALRARDKGRVLGELEALVQLCGNHGALLKVILETCLLSEAEKRLAVDLACAAGAHFIKTSTGFGSLGATTTDVAMMRQRAPAHVGVKAAGGLRDLSAVLAMLKAGATRLGCSNSMAILDELQPK